MTDFTSTNPETMCTPFDIWFEHPRFNPKNFPSQKLQRYCMDATEIIRTMLSRFYSDSSLKISPWASPIIPATIWDDPEEDSDNVEDSWEKFPGEEAGFRGVTVTDNKDTVFTQYYTIELTSTTAFTLDASVEGSQGNASTTTILTSTNGDVVIPADSDFGTFIKDNKFYFAIYPWDRLIHYISRILATALAMRREYGRDQEDEQSVAKSMAKEAMGFLDRMLRPDAKDGIRLATLGARSLNVKVLPYDVTFLGQDVTKISPNNKDSDGNRGEAFGLFDLFNESDDFGLFG